MQKLINENVRGIAKVRCGFLAHDLQEFIKLKRSSACLFVDFLFLFICLSVCFHIVAGSFFLMAIKFNQAVIHDL